MFISFYRHQWKLNTDSKNRGAATLLSPRAVCKTNSDICGMAMQVLSWQTPNDLILEQQAISKFLLGQDKKTFSIPNFGQIPNGSVTRPGLLLFFQWELALKHILHVHPPSQASLRIHTQALPPPCFAFMVHHCSSQYSGS